MLPSERKQRILAVLKERREVSVQALAEILDAAPANVRRDLRELEEESRISRRHGRAIYRPTLVPVGLEDEDDLDATLLDGLVTEAAHVLGEARNLFLSGGPVLARAARKLSGKTIATHDLALAMAAASSDNDVTLVGREIDNRTMTLRSSSFDRELEEFYFDAAVIEVDGVDERNLWVARKNHGFLTKLLDRSDSFVAIAKSTCLGRKGDRVAGPLTGADLLVVDSGVSEAARKALHDSGIEVRVAGESDGDGLAFEKVGNVFLLKRGADRFGSASGAAGGNEGEARGSED